MPTPLHSSLDVSVKFREQYVSEALNKKMQAIPRGIIRGANLTPTVGNNQFQIVVDPLTNDTVINAVGVASVASGTAAVYPVTYRSTSPLTATVVAGSGLNFIYFIGGYSPLTTTAASIQAFTETEFENGDPDDLGGVLLGVVVAQATAIPLTADRILYSGMSNGVTGATKRIPFRRHNCENFIGGQGFRPARERVASRMDFGYKAGTRVPYTIRVLPFFAPDFQDAGTVFAYDGTISSPIGTGALKYVPAGADLINTTVILEGDAFDVPKSTTYPKKLRYEIIYRTVGAFVGNVLPSVDSIGSSGGSITPLTVPAYAPSSTTIAASTDWALYVIEFDLSSGNIASVKPQVFMQVANGSIQIASVTCIFSEVAGVAAQLDYGASLGSSTPNSYGNLAVSAPLHQSTAVSPAVSLLQVKDTTSSLPSQQQKGWRIGNVPSQFYDPSALPNGPNLYFVPEMNSPFSRLQIGYAAAQDVETGALEARYANVQILGNGEGASASYSVTLNNTPLKVDEIRPNNGYGATSNRIDVRNANGTISAPTYFSSSGTAAATCVIQYAGGLAWTVVGGTANFINIASITTIALGLTFTFTAPLYSASASIPSAIYHGSGSYFAKVTSFTNADCAILLVDATGSSSLAVGDRVYFSVIGRLA